MIKQDQVRVPVRIEVEIITSRQDQERREHAQAHRPITEQNVLDWRSYDRHAVPNRWRVW